MKFTSVCKYMYDDLINSDLFCIGLNNLCLDNTFGESELTVHQFWHKKNSGITDTPVKLTPS